eukprot:GILJ01001581.1.p1 GENE.GILJ01001581.1~~GILJ01001581.1.p1  ORF type:complete len:416 (-),score=68.92 GILJ01001581.1:106-1353(-)
MQQQEELLKALSREERDVVSQLLSSDDLSYGYKKRIPYTQLKNNAKKKQLRTLLLELAYVLGRGSGTELLLECCEEMQTGSVEIVGADGTRRRKRRRKGVVVSPENEDLASRLLSNLSKAYRDHARKRSEKRRILSVAANDITFSEGSRIFGCGPVQFSEAKKHFKKHGPFAELKNKPKKCKRIDDVTENLVDSFWRRPQYCEKVKGPKGKTVTVRIKSVEEDGYLEREKLSLLVSKETVWNDFKKAYPELANTKIRHSAFIARMPKEMRPKTKLSTSSLPVQLSRPALSMGNMTNSNLVNSTFNPASHSTHLHLNQGPGSHMNMMHGSGHLLHDSNGMPSSSSHPQMNNVHIPTHIEQTVLSSGQINHMGMIQNRVAIPPTINQHPHPQMNQHLNQNVSRSPHQTGASWQGFGQ